MKIRWDSARLADMAADLEGKGALLMALRNDMIDTCARAGRRAVDSTTMVIASLWAEASAGDLLVRQRLLTEAENQLLWDLTPPPPADGLRAPLRARTADDISAELDAALAQLATAPAGLPDGAAARAELRAIELTYELAVAHRNRALLDRQVPDPAPSLSALIDYLGYELALARPAPHVEWQRVAEATAAVRRLLDESWFADVGRGDLLAIHENLAGLPGPELDAVIRGLSDDEIYRWFHEFDGVRGGNVSADEEAALFETLAAAASAATLFRLAGAEGGSRFMQIAAAVQRTAPAEVAIEFIEACAAYASASDEALLAALGGLAALDRRHRSISATSLQLQGLLEPLAAATAGFLERQAIERDDPVVVEFFEGVGSAIGTAVMTLGELTVVGLVNRDRFRRTWSEVGGIARLAFTDPGVFLQIVLDIETLRRNPARWTGSALAGFLTAGIGRLARLGRLGAPAGSTAARLERLSNRAIISRPRLRARHVSPVLDRVGVALDAAAVTEAIAELARVDEHLEELDETFPASSDSD